MQESKNENSIDPELLEQNNYFDSEQFSLYIGIPIFLGFLIMLLFDKIAEIIKIVLKFINKKNILLSERYKDDKYHCEFEKIEDRLEQNL